MNKTAAAAGSASITTLLILFAMHGKGAGEALMGLWLVLNKFTEDAPFGLVSFLLALALAIGFAPFLRKWLPGRVSHPEARRFAVDVGPILVGFLVMWLQLRTLPGLMSGILAGLAAPPIQKGLAALWALAGRSLGLAAAPPEPAATPTPPAPAQRVPGGEE
jgi:hypothetical protein